MSPVRRSSATARFRGLTLIETIVYSVLLLIVLGITFAVLIASMRNYHIYLGLTEVEQGAATANSRLAWELVEANPGAIAADSTGIVFVSPRDANGNVQMSGGSIVWPKLVCYYLDEINGVNCLVRKEETLTPPQTGTPSVPSGRTPSWFKTAALDQQIIARHVASLDVTLGYPIKLAVKAECSPVGLPNTISMTTSLIPRN